MRYEAPPCSAAPIAHPIPQSTYDVVITARNRIDVRQLFILTWCREYKETGPASERTSDNELNVNVMQAS